MRTSVKCGRFTITIHRGAVNQSDDIPRPLILRVWRGRPDWRWTYNGLLWQVTEPLSAPGWIHSAWFLMQQGVAPACILQLCRHNGLTAEMEGEA